MSNYEALQRDLESTKERVARIEEKVDSISNELKEKSVSDARIEQSLQIMQNSIQIMQNDMKEIREKMMDLLLKALDQNSNNTQDEKAFYRKLIISCVTVLVTILLSILGISKIIPLP